MSAAFQVFAARTARDATPEELNDNLREVIALILDDGVRSVSGHEIYLNAGRIS